MNIDITLLNQHIKSEIIIEEDVIFSDDYFKSSEIKRLKDVHINGVVFLDEENELVLKASIIGKMILEDSISLEDVEYPFFTEIYENLEKSEGNFENTLDIIDVLWQNIVLEVPLRFTGVDDYSKYQGEGWKLLSEEEMKTSNNPFEDLKSIFGKE